MKSKWICLVCAEKSLTKKDLIDHLKNHYDEASYTVDESQAQLEELGVDKPWE